MKKIFLALAVMAMAAAGSTAHAGVRFSIGIPAPVVSFGYAAPVYAPAPPVVYAPAPQVVCAPPVVYAPPPVVVYRAPRYYRPVPSIYRAPAPVVRFGFGFGPYGGFYGHGHW